LIFAPPPKSSQLTATDLNEIDQGGTRCFPAIQPPAGATLTPKNEFVLRRSRGVLIAQGATVPA
jgi:hypothetical protein